MSKRYQNSDGPTNWHLRKHLFNMKKASQSKINKGNLFEETIDLHWRQWGVGEQMCMNQTGLGRKNKQCLNLQHPTQICKVEDCLLQHKFKQMWREYVFVMSITLLIWVNSRFLTNNLILRMLTSILPRALH